MIAFLVINTIILLSHIIIGLRRKTNNKEIYKMVDNINPDKEFTICKENIYKIRLFK
jgi:hypothetical protein